MVNQWHLDDRLTLEWLERRYPDIRGRDNALLSAVRSEVAAVAATSGLSCRHHIEWCVDNEDGGMTPPSARLEEYLDTLEGAHCRVPAGQLGLELSA